jgi:hypothetical protein
MNELFSEKNLRLSQEQIAAVLKQQAKSLTPRKPKKEIDFYQFPTPAFDAIIRSGYTPAFAVAAAIHRTWFENYQQNPITLTSVRLAGFLISRGQKLRALKILEETGYYKVRRFPRRNPQVTLKWLRLRD